MVIVRYFGGTLLGVGPLSRAYTKSFKDAVGKCEKNIFQEYIIEEIECEYSEELNVKKQFEIEGKEVLKTEYLDNIKITVKKVK